MTDFDASAQVFSQAVVLMVVGMGFVFAFLSLLIVVIKVFIAPLAQRFPDSVNSIITTHKTPHTEATATVAAITAAISQYRQTHK